MRYQGNSRVLLGTILIVLISAGSLFAGADSLTMQMKINKSTLLESSTDQIRIDAASVMLFSDDKAGRAILLDILSNPDNPKARQSICKSLIQARIDKRHISSRFDFMDPLLAMLVGKDASLAKLAAEATLIFDYSEIAKSLEKLATDPSLSVESRLNVIYALKLQPDMKAIFKLMDILDDKESLIAEEAEKAIRSLGIPIDRDKRIRKQIREGLKRKGKSEFLRDWLIRQDEQIRNCQKQVDYWQKRYFASIEILYSGKTDSDRGTFLTDQLASSNRQVKLWSLEKILQWRKSTNPKLPKELGQALIKLISDDERDVRYKTAHLLSLMSQLDSSAKLLEQFKKEKDLAVQVELLTALSASCHYALSPNSGIELDPTIRKETLDLAAGFLGSADSDRIKKGASIIKKLLESNGMESEAIESYLGLLFKRYESDSPKLEPAVRSHLLSVMAQICGQNSLKTEGAKAFNSLFEKGLLSDNILIRQSSVDGLINIDNTKALRVFRQAMINDSSKAIRAKIIDLAGSIGSKDDFVWLIGRFGSDDDIDQVWRSILDIAKRSDSIVLGELLSHFSSSLDKVSLAKYAPILLIAEQKSVSESNVAVTFTSRNHLAQLYSRDKDFDKSVKYWSLLAADSENVNKRDHFLSRLLNAYFVMDNFEQAYHLLSNSILEGDLLADGEISSMIDSHLSKSSVAKQELLRDMFGRLKITDKSPNWQKKSQSWKKK